MQQVVETYNNVVKAKKAIGGRKMILGYDGAQDGHHELVMHNRPRAMLSGATKVNKLLMPLIITVNAYTLLLNLLYEHFVDFI